MYIIYIHIYVSHLYVYTIREVVYIQDKDSNGSPWTRFNENAMDHVKTNHSSSRYNNSLCDYLVVVYFGIRQ